MTWRQQDPAGLVRQSLNYREQGATAGTEPPPGYRAFQRSVVVGVGARVFERAGDALMSWQMHRRAGLRVVSETPTAVVGSDVLLVLGRPPLALRAPCRVIRVVTEPARCGFAYGTVTGHPEQGEEFFVVTLSAEGNVVFTARAFSRPATRLARLAGPLTRLAQDLATSRYLRALAAIAVDDSA